jgi:carbonic anhydrase/acetyltransferase-like protein (isoleucine patch superfamily)
MALIKSVRGLSPKYGSTCWFADNATVVGEVIMGEHCTVWFNAVVRGDVNTIQMGDYVNIQDEGGDSLHLPKGLKRLLATVSIAHNAIIHGCTIEDKVLIGMGRL